MTPREKVDALLRMTVANGCSAAEQKSARFKAVEVAKKYGIPLVEAAAPPPPPPPPPPNQPSPHPGPAGWQNPYNNARPGNAGQRRQQNQPPPPPRSTSFVTVKCQDGDYLAVPTRDRGPKGWAGEYSWLVQPMRAHAGGGPNVTFEMYVKGAALGTVYILLKGEEIGYYTKSGLSWVVAGITGRGSVRTYAEKLRTERECHLYALGKWD